MRQFTSPSSSFCRKLSDFRRRRRQYDKNLYNLVKRNIHFRKKTGN